MSRTRCRAPRSDRARVARVAVPEVEPDSEEAREGLAELKRRFDLEWKGRPPPMSGATFRRAREIVDDHAAWFLGRYALCFPRLVPFVLPSIGHLNFQRADLPHSEISRHLLFLLESLRRGGSPPPRVEELAAAVAAAWPDYRPPTEELAGRGLLSRPN